MTHAAPGQTRRRTLAATAAALAGGALAACGADGAGTPQGTGAGAPALTRDNITLTWATPGNQQELEVYAKVAENFTRAHPNIQITADRAASDLPKLVSLIAGGTPPDVMFATINNWPSLAAQGVWAPLDDLIKRDRFDLPDFFPQIVKPYRYDGKRFGDGPLYGLAKEIAVRAMYYNADHLQEAGLKPPAPEQAWTWDEFRQATRRLTKRPAGAGAPAQQYGYAMETWWGMWAIWAWANGGEVVDDPWAPTKATMEAGPVVDALDFWGGLVNKEQVAPPLAAYRDLGKSDHFAQGKASLYNNGRWMVPLFRRSTFNWDVMLMPRQKQRAQFLTGSIFGLSKATRWQNEFLGPAAVREQQGVAGPDDRAGAAVPLPAVRGPLGHLPQEPPPAAQRAVPEGRGGGPRAPPAPPLPGDGEGGGDGVRTPCWTGPRPPPPPRRR